MKTTTRQWEIAPTRQPSSTLLDHAAQTARRLTPVAVVVQRDAQRDEELAQLRADNAMLKAALANSRPKLAPLSPVETNHELEHYRQVAALPPSLSQEGLQGFRGQAKAWFWGFAGLGLGLGTMMQGIGQIKQMMGW